MGEVFNKLKSAFVLPEKLAYILAFIGISLRYCRRILSNIKKCYIVGHSKGANLALFSAAHLSDDELSHVERIFLNDEPGFCRILLISPVSGIFDGFLAVTGSGVDVSGVYGFMPHALLQHKNILFMLVKFHSKAGA